MPYSSQVPGPYAGTTTRAKKVGRGRRTDLSQVPGPYAGTTTARSISVA